MIGKIVKGTGFRGALDYVLGKKDAELLFTTLGSRDARGQAAELAAYRKLRPRLGKAVFHCSLAIGKEDNLTGEQWQAIAAKYIENMGFGDAPYTLVRHKDADHDHVHIVASRVRSDGSVVSDSKDFKKTENILREIEVEYGLTQVTNSAEAEVKAVTIAELEKADRKDAPPPRLVLQEVVGKIADEVSTFTEFAEALDAAGVDLKPTLQSDNEKWTGAAFRLRDDADGLWFGGSKLGNKFKTGSLIKKYGVVYDKDRDLETALECQRRAELEPVKSTERSSGSDESLVREADSNGRTDRAEERADEAAARDSEAVSRRDSAEVAESGAGSDTGSGSEQDRDTGKGRDDRANEISGGSDSGVNSDNIADEVTRIAAEAPGPKPKHIKVKEAAFDAQHAVLQAPGYRITLKPRRKGDPVIIPGNHYGTRKKELEQFFTAEEVKKQFAFLSLKNSQDYDVYITPKDPNYHYIVVDDLTEESKEHFLSEGYEPCLIQESSENNWQAVLKAPKPEVSKKEQSAANEAVVNINKKYGDPAFSSVEHPFRVAGFANKKPGKNSPYTKIVSAVNRVCAKTIDILDRIRSKRKKAELERIAQREAAAMQREAQAQERQAAAFRARVQAGHQSSNDNTNLAQVFDNYKNKMKTTDESRKDFGACLGMLQAGYSIGEVENALLLSPDTERKGASALDYADRTVTAAYAAFEKQQYAAANIRKNDITPEP